MTLRHRPTPRAQWHRLLVGAGAALLLAGCTSGSDAPSTGPVSASTTGVSASPSAAPPGSVADRVEEFTPALMTVLSPPRWFTGTDGTVHLVYELQLTNAFPVASTVTQVVVRDAATGAALQTLSGDRLTASMSLLTSGTEPTTELAPSKVGVIWFDVPLYDASAVPASSAVRHRLQQDHGPGLPGVRDRSENESWPTYDQPALAVADAQVIVAEAGSGPDPRGGHTGRMVFTRSTPT